MSYFLRHCTSVIHIIIGQIYLASYKKSIVGRLGFTFIETLIVISIVLTLLSLATMSVLGSQRSANLTEAVDIFVSDLRSQQSKAMMGQTKNGVASAGYGVQIAANQYTLFSGTSYTESDPANTVIQFNPPVYASAIGFPNQSIIFLAGSGEISGFIQGANTVSLNESNSNQSKTIYINQYGVITGVQ